MLVNYVQYFKNRKVVNQGQFAATLRDKILDIVRDIPRGEVRTYKQVATAAGRPRAYRAVGNVLAKNFDPAIPCHRVIRSDGKIGGYNRGVKRKQQLLREEGAMV